MALNINGVGQNSIHIDGIDLDSLYIDGVLVFSKNVERFRMILTSESIPLLTEVDGGTLTVEDLGPAPVYAGNEYLYTSNDIITHFRVSNTDVHVAEIINGTTLTSLDNTFNGVTGMLKFDWTGACNITSMISAFRNNTFMNILDWFDTSKVTNFTSAWEGQLNMRSIPSYDYSSALSVTNAWKGCSNLEVFPAADMPLCINFLGAWNGCSSLTSFPEIDISSGEDFEYTWLYCSGFEYFPELDFSSALNLDSTWYGCSSMEYIGAINSINATNGYRLFFGCSSLICLTSLNTENMTVKDLLFNGCTSLIAPNTTEQADLIDANGAIYINASACPLLNPEPPIYLMTEALTDDGTYQFLHNSSISGSIYNGRLEHSSQSTDGTEGAPWFPTNAQYPDDPLPAPGWIDLNVNGNATRQINTQWTPSANDAWSFTSVYNVNFGISYDAYTLNYDGLGNLDIYLWSSTESVPLTPTYAGVPYTPEQIEWIIKETPPDIINVSGIIYEMDNFPTY